LHYLILDTCIWIYLAEEKYEGALLQLENLVNKGKVSLIIPEQIQSEWNNGKADIVRGHFEESIKGTLKNAKSLNNYLNHEERDIFSKLINDVEDRKDQYSKERANRNIEKVEDLMRGGTVCSTTDANKLNAIEMGLSKKAPFHKKGSIADALIILSSVEFLTKQGFANAYFISGNTKDFGDENNPSIIHPDLTDLFESVGLQYSINVKEVFKTIDQSIVSDEEVKEVEKINKEMYILEPPNCDVCSTPMRGAYLRSQYGGLTWQWLCTKGHSRIDTGDFWD
jgi:hypothetical protein